MTRYLSAVMRRRIAARFLHRVQILMFFAQLDYLFRGHICAVGHGVVVEHGGKGRGFQDCVEVRCCLTPVTAIQKRRARP